MNVVKTCLAIKISILVKISKGDVIITDTIRLRNLHLHCWFCHCCFGNILNMFTGIRLPSLPVFILHSNTALFCLLLFSSLVTMTDCTLLKLKDLIVTKLWLFLSVCLIHSRIHHHTGMPQGSVVVWPILYCVLGQPSAYLLEVFSFSTSGTFLSEGFLHCSTLECLVLFIMPNFFSHVKMLAWLSNLFVDYSFCPGQDWSICYLTCVLNCCELFDYLACHCFFLDAINKLLFSHVSCS